MLVIKPDNFTTAFKELQRTHAEILTKMMQMSTLVSSVCHQHYAEVAKYQRVHQQSPHKQLQESLDFSHNSSDEHLPEEARGSKLVTLQQLHPSSCQRHSKRSEAEPMDEALLSTFDSDSPDCQQEKLQQHPSEDDVDELRGSAEECDSSPEVPDERKPDEGHAQAARSLDETAQFTTSMFSTGERSQQDETNYVSEGARTGDEVYEQSQRCQHWRQESEYSYAGQSANSMSVYECSSPRNVGSMSMSMDTTPARDPFRLLKALQSYQKAAIEQGTSLDKQHNRWRMLAVKLLMLDSGVSHRLLRPEWSPDFVPEQAITQLSTVGKVHSLLVDSHVSVKDKVFAGSSVRSQTTCQFLFLHPESAVARLVLAISMLALAYDLITLPYLLCFAVKSRLVSAVDFGLALFWTCSMVLSCLTGYHSQHVVEMRPSKVVAHYWMTWGMLDLVLVVSDWLGVVLAQHDLEGDPTTSWLSLGRTLKYYRFLRVLRMLRLFKLMQALRFYVDSFAAEVTLVVLRLLCNILCVFLVNHYIACVWCAIAYYNMTDDTTWSQAMSLQHAQAGYVYVVALHWSMTQFTPATNNIFPTNLRERVFASFVVLFGLIIFSSFIGSLTSAIAQLKKIHLDRYSEEVRIRKFIIERHVSLQCARCIWNFYRSTHGSSSAANICLDDISCFVNLPKVTRMRLHADISMPIITKHPLFSHLDMISNDALLQVCEEALTEMGLHTNKEIFHAGAPADSMLFLNSGSVVYERDDSLDSTTLQAPSFISEASLWTVGFHAGSLNAVSASHMLRLDAHSFVLVLRQACAPEIFECACTYARSFMERIVACVSDGFGVTDIVSPKDAKLYNKLCLRFAADAFGGHLPGRTSRLMRVSRQASSWVGLNNPHDPMAISFLRFPDNRLSRNCKKLQSYFFPN